MHYAYWIIPCKSCGFRMRLGYIGPYEKGSNEIPVYEEGGLDKVCLGCGKSHFYKRSEALLLLDSQPPPPSAKP